MLNLEQVRLLEERVGKTIDLVRRLSDENSGLRGRLDVYQNRIAELEALIKSFREDQGKIEDGILSALDKLNQFEDMAGQAPEAQVAAKTPASPTPPKPAAPAASKNHVAAKIAAAAPAPAAEKTPEKDQAEIEIVDDSGTELDIF